LHHESQTFLYSWFCTLLITDCTYYDVFLYKIFWKLLYILTFTTKYFLQPHHLLRHPNCEGGSFISKFNKSYIRNIVTNSCIQGDSRIVDINVGYGSNFLWLWSPILNSCEHMTVNTPSDFKEFSKKLL